MFYVCLACYRLFIAETPCRISNFLTFSPLLLCETSDFLALSTCRLVSVTTMTSADFSDYGFPCSETSPGKSFFLYPITAASTYLSTKHHFGRYKGVVAYPKQICLICRSCSSVPDFAVSLPSVHTSRYTTLRLANASDTTPCVRDFHPLEKKHLLKALFNQNYLYFWNFSVALQQVRAAHAGRTSSRPPCR